MSLASRIRALRRRGRIRKSRIVSRSITVMLCCNDPGNGEFTGRLTGLEVGGCSLTIWPFESIDGSGEDGVPLTLWDGGIVVGWRSFPASDYCEHVGNWCWDAVEMDRRTALRLLRYIAELGADVESAPVGVFEALTAIRKRSWEAAPDA